MAAIALAESSCRARDLNDDRETGDLSYGLWQINMIDYPDYKLGEERRGKLKLTNNDEFGIGAAEFLQHLKEVEPELLQHLKVLLFFGIKVLPFYPLLSTDITSEKLIRSKTKKNDFTFLTANRFCLLYTSDAADE